MSNEQLELAYSAASNTPRRLRKQRAALAFALCAGWALSTSGCAETDGANVGVTQAALRRVGSCADAARVVRRAALESMNARIDELVEDARANAGGPTVCIQATSAGSAATGAQTTAAPPPAATAAAPPATSTRSAGKSGSASESSTTNNQVAGVDEADFIKNDSKYVYAAMNHALRIIEAWPAQDAHEVAKVVLPGTARKLFVEKDRALVYVSVDPSSDNAASPARVRRDECSYGYDCEFAGDGTDTVVLVFDISDRTAPQQLRRIELGGSLLAARRIGDAVHTVLATPELNFPGVTYPNLASSCGRSTKPADQAVAELEQARAQNAKIIMRTELEGLVPRVSENDRSYTDSSCADVYAETLPTGSAFTTLVSLDMTQNAAPAVATIISKPGAVYASADALYVAINQHKAIEGVPDARDFSSVIHKFEIGEDVQASAYVASGQVKGNVLNQFSMDEYDQHLRVATSFGKVPDPNVHSTLSVLSQRGDALALDGKVDDIAPHEDIRSVRFDGERGYVVTFKKTDPLYVFDLADPAHPAIAGELKIPGFSTYMHMLDQQHLLTIGYDAADQGNFAFFTGVLLQIFDVSDMQDPKLAHKTVIGTRGSSSEALTNHLAFTLFKDKLAVPMTICEDGTSQGGFGTNMTFSGLMVFDIGLATGITERGRVAHPGSDGMYDSASCSNWWTSSGSVVQRSVFMDDFVYSIANDMMRVQDLDALGADVASIPLDH